MIWPPAHQSVYSPKMYLCTYLTFVVILGILKLDRTPVQNWDLLIILVSMAELKTIKALNSRSQSSRCTNFATPCFRRALSIFSCQRIPESLVKLFEVKLQGCGTLLVYGRIGAAESHTRGRSGIEEHPEKG